MRIGLIGGIFGMSQEFRSTNLQETTETILERELTARGHDVITDRHRLWNDLDGVDILHVHHLANSCLQLPARRLPIVFTRHATKPLHAHHRGVLEATYRRADRIVALSHREKQDFVPQRFWWKTEVVYGGISADRFTSLEKPVRSGPIRMLYVGQLIELKRVHLAIALLAHVRAKVGPAELDIFSQRETLRPQLERFARDTEIADAVRFHGAIPQDQVATVMAASDMLLLPSRTEALSTVVSEAILTGLPVLCFDVGGAREQVPSGWALPAPEDVLGWMNQGVSALRDMDATGRLFAEHRPLAVERFSIPEMVDHHERIYQEVSR